MEKKSVYRATSTELAFDIGWKIGVEPIVRRGIICGGDANRPALILREAGNPGRNALGRFYDDWSLIFEHFLRRPSLVAYGDTGWHAYGHDPGSPFLLLSHIPGRC